MASPAETPEARTARLLRQQAAGCAAMGSRLYEMLLIRAADDLLANGPTLRALDGHLEDPGASALALRMLGGVHALVLGGRTPELARHYPSSTSYDATTGPPEQAWPQFVAVLEECREEVREWLLRPPQTNEVGRSAALIGGLLHLVSATPLPIRLVEVGASGGLNLLADRFRISGEVGEYGDPDSPVQLGDAWLGIAPPAGRLEIVERFGADVDPVDVTTDAGRLLLTAYVWPDQAQRLSRLRGAFEIAQSLPTEVRQEPAIATLTRTELCDDTWTVLWHSVFQQYVSAEERAAMARRIEELGATAEDRRPFAHLKLEPERPSPGQEPKFLVTLQTWPGGKRRVLAAASGHGVPTTWEIYI